MSDKPNPYDAPTSGDAVASKDDRLFAMLAHLLGIVTLFIGSLIIWIIKKDDSEFIGDQAKEALNFQITVFIGYAISTVLMCFVVGYFLWMAIYVADIVFCIIAGMQANNGVRYRYPFCLRLIK